MDFKNEINFDLKIIPKGEKIYYDGIEFSNIAYVLVIIDNVNIFNLEPFEESFVVLKELEKSIYRSGNYLLFTSVSGIADDAGWDYIEVLHINDSIVWNIKRESNSLRYVFDKNQYLKEFIELVRKIENMDQGLKLEPLYIIYPDG